MLRFSQWPKIAPVAKIQRTTLLAPGRSRRRLRNAPRITAVSVRINTQVVNLACSIRFRRAVHKLDHHQRFRIAWQVFPVDDPNGITRDLAGIAAEQVTLLPKTLDH